MATTKYKKVTLWLEPKHIKYLNKVSKKNKQSMSRIIRCLIETEYNNAGF